MQGGRGDDSLVEGQVRARIAELMSSGGLGYNQISQEILYLLPHEFVVRYISLWEMALGSAGGGDARGQQLARDAQLGKHKTETAKKGQKIGAGAGANGKRWKKMGFEIKSEAALELKSRIDRRLRAIGRDIKEFEDAGGERRKGGKDGGSGGGVRIIKCRSCGKIMEESWVCCPWDGSRIDAPK